MIRVLASVLLVTGLVTGLAAAELPYPIVDTGQSAAYGTGAASVAPEPGSRFDGQDAQYRAHPQSYRDNDDGTVTDMVTGLMWQKDPPSRKYDQQGSEAYAQALSLAGHQDWRLPTIKELFSIAHFDGNVKVRRPYIDTTAFGYPVPTGTQGMDSKPGERFIDAQYATASYSLGITMGRDHSAFGFNFADGRIKAYPLQAQRYARCVRGNPAYGHNDFVANGDGTVTDRATGLTWLQADSQHAMDWPAALAWAEGLSFAGHDDWRVPTVKELQSLVDYNRAPAASDPAQQGPAIDPIFSLHDPDSWAWSSTTHLEFTGGAYYVTFGRAWSAGRKIDAHGAGAVRSDPKTGDPARYAQGHGPQKDEVRILNYVRAVRGGGAVRQDVVAQQASPQSPQSPMPETGKPPRASSAPGGASHFIERFDRNGDGAVSRAEFTGKIKRFETLDSNADGTVTAAEAAAGPGPRAEAPSSSTTTLEVVTVGTGSPLFNAERGRPCMMVTYGGKILLCDLGAGSVVRLEADELRIKDIAGVLFTHHHRDHNADAMNLLPTLWQRGLNVPVVGPAGTQALAEFLRTFYAEDLEYRTRKSGNAVAPASELAIYQLPGPIPSLIPGLTVTTTPVNHSIATQAYRFEAGGRSIVISGDLSFSESLIELAQGADLLVCDSGAIPYQGEQQRAARPAAVAGAASGAASGESQHAHASLEDIATMAAQSQVATLVLVHFRPGQVDEDATRQRMSEIFSGNIVFAEDMQRF
ncbi:MAG: DUF1566 domain-containing protein [Planctomycetota bacterium]|jgi:ribonuclease BN (tRNA processing enzyme)|nr:DUF1566 domain-containing protein [Planctomycetota bacterium]